MDAVVDNISKGGGKPKCVGDVLQGGGAGSTYFRVGDVGDEHCMGRAIGEVQHRVNILITGR